MKSMEKLDRKIFGSSILTPFVTPDMPKIKDPATAPDPESPEAKRAAQREMAKRRKSGRASTVLTGSDNLG